MSSADLLARIVDLYTSDFPELIVVLGGVAAIRIVFRLFMVGAPAGRLNV
jgi:hypothetical protein